MERLFVLKTLSRTQQATKDNYGLDVIDVRDNGSGISRADAINMARPHYTSKLGSLSDLASLQSYGFRGEALSSIAAVADLQVTTCTTEDDVAHTYMFNHAGEIITCKPSAMGPGTLVHVMSLFKNIPVRRQYFKSVRRCREDLKRAEDVMMAFGIANPKVRFVLKHDKCVVWQKIQTEDYSSNLAIVFGSCVTQFLTEFTFNSDDPVVQLRGHVPNRNVSISDISGLSRSSPDRLFIFVNSRPVFIKPLAQILRQVFVGAYPSLSARYPVATLHLDVPPASLDINLEPNKTSVLLNDMDYISSTLLSLLSQLYEVPEKEPVRDDSQQRREAAATLSMNEEERQVEEEHLQQPWQQVVEPASDMLDSSTSSSPASALLSRDGSTEPLRDTGHYFPPPLTRSLQASPNSTTADSDVPLEDSLVDRDPAWLEDGEADTGSNGSLCQAGEKTSNSQVTLLQWSRGRLLQDSCDRTVEPVRLLQPLPARDHQSNHSTPSHKPTATATTATKPILPKQSPVYDMINSRPVKRGNPSDYNGELSSSKRQKIGKFPTRSGDVTTPRDQPVLTFEPVLRSKPLFFNLNNIRERNSITERDDVCAAEQDKVIGYCKPPGVWMVVWKRRIACFTSARLLEVQGFPVKRSQVQTLLDHTLCTMPDLTSHLYTIHTLGD